MTLGSRPIYAQILVMTLHVYIDIPNSQYERQVANQCRALLLSLSIIYYHISFIHIYKNKEKRETEIRK